MLKSLTIEDFAIIDEVSIDFSQGMTVLSGETGAGKSILIDALGLLCGGRGSTDYIRTDKERFVVEGLFEVDEYPSALTQTLETFGIDLPTAEDGLIIRREINQRGSNLIRVNGQLANVSLLREIGNHLADIHGQNEHQALLDKSQHLVLLDQYGGADFQKLLGQYQEVYETYRQVRHRLLEVLQEDQDDQQRLEFLKFQSQEIADAHLVEGEEEELLKVSKRLQNAQKIHDNLQNINYLLTESEQNVFSNLTQVIDLLKDLKEDHEDYPALIDEFETAYFEMEALAHRVALSDPGLYDDNDSIDEVEERLGELSALKSKYGREIQELMDYHQTMDEEIYNIEHKEQVVEGLTQELTDTYATAFGLAQELHDHRLANSQRLVKAIEEELQDLYMENARFAVKFNKVPFDDSFQDQEILALNSKGFEDAEFFASTNVGENIKPLIQVASGGELSRFMLALKTVFSRNQAPRVMVFDEIDTGVSGRVAKAIAQKIHQVAENHQVLCITHLPQVAAIADRQLLIQKVIEHGRTRSQVALLFDHERVDNVAGMISGDHMSKTSQQLAQEMLTTMQEGKEM